RRMRQAGVQPLVDAVDQRHQAGERRLDLSNVLLDAAEPIFSAGLAHPMPPASAPSCQEFIPFSAIFQNAGIFMAESQHAARGPENFKLRQYRSFSPLAGCCRVPQAMADASFALLDDRGVLAISGPDRRSFLQGLVSNDTEKVGPAQARYAALLTAQ